MELLNNLVSNVNELLWSKVLIVMLIVLGLYFTFRTNFVQFRFFKEMFRLLGDGAKGDKKDGSVSSFQAFCISTASRVGTGNIAGIAMAVVAGGPGSVFWMWLIALIGSASSFVESTLAQIYKVKDGYSIEIGGEMETISDAMGDLVLMITLAVVFVYLVMVAQFQSLLSPFIVMFTIPLAFTGGLLALLITGNDL